MGRASQEFDEKLFTLKMSEPARQMHIESEASIKAAFQGASGPARLGGSVLIRIVDGQLVVLRKLLETVDRICREVWQTQGETITPEFVRKTLVPKAISTIGPRVGEINECIEHIEGQPHSERDAARHGLAMNVNRLKAEVASRYEIEVCELEYKSPGVPEKAPAPVGNAAASSIIPTSSKKRDPEVAKRRALVKSNAGVSVPELCQIFDRENVPLPAKWQAAGFKSWVEVHKKHPTRIKVIVSKDRRSD